MEITLITTEEEYIVLIQAMRKVIPFMELMKEVSFVFDINLPKPEVLCKVFEDNQSCISVSKSNKFSPRKNISLLSIIITKSLYKRILLGYDKLIQENKQQTFSPSHSTKHYSSIHEENYLDGDLKSETFAFTQGSLRIQRTTQYHN